ncbi:MAG: hypothetical protein ACPLRW_01145 [Moorellales bacterium]
MAGLVSRKNTRVARLVALLLLFGFMLMPSVGGWAQAPAGDGTAGSGGSVYGEGAQNGSSVIDGTEEEIPPLLDTESAAPPQEPTGDPGTDQQPTASEGPGAAPEGPGPDQPPLPETEGQLEAPGTQEEQPGQADAGAPAILAAVSGPAEFHAEQLQVMAYFSLSFRASVGEGLYQTSVREEVYRVSGEVYLRVVDGEGNVLAAMPKNGLDNQYSTLWYYLYFSRPASPGQYRLEVVLNGEPLPPEAVSYNDGPAEVAVTDRVLVTFVYNAWLGGRRAIPGDCSVYFEVQAFGLDEPQALEVELYDESENRVSTGSTGWLRGRTADGQAQVLYRVELGEPLSEGDYRIGLTGRNGAEVSLASSVQTTFSPDSEVKIYAAEATDPAVGELTLKLQNVPAGEYTVKLEKLSGVVDALEQEVTYSGGEILPVQFSRDGEPAYLEGTYRVGLYRGNQLVGNEWARPQVRIGYGDDYCSGRYTAATVLKAGPTRLRETLAPQTINLSATLANVSGQDPVRVELVEVDANGNVKGEPGENGETVEKVLGRAQDLALTEGFDSRGYRFDNVYTLNGSIEVQGVSAHAEYRWRFTCANTAGKTRTFMYSAPVRAYSRPSADRVVVLNGLEAQGHEGFYEEQPAGAAPVFLVSTRESGLGFALEDPFGIDDPGQLRATLYLPASYTEVGTLAGSPARDGDRIIGEITLSDSLQDGATYILEATYGEPPEEVGRARVVAAAAAGAQSLSLHESEAGRLLPAGKEARLTLKGALNVDPEQLSLALSPLTGEGEEVAIAGAGLAATAKGRDLELVGTADTDLSGWYELSLLQDGNPLRRLFLSPQGGLEASPYGPTPVLFTERAFVAGWERAAGGLVLTGGNFSGENSYQVLLYAGGEPAPSPVLLTAQFRDERTLLVPEEDLAAVPGGEYRVCVLESDRVLPVSQAVTLELNPGGAQLVWPTVEINNGATSTTSPEVTVSVNPGTFTAYKLAESPEGLDAAQWQAVTRLQTLTFPYTLSEGYGKKTLYFRFRDDSGQEVSAQATITYRSAALAEPREYGLSASVSEGVYLLREGERVSFWIKVAQAGLSAGATLLDANGNAVATLALPRTAREGEVTTYSATLTVPATGYDGVTRAVFSLKEPPSGAEWQAEVPVGFRREIMIGSAEAVFDRFYAYTASGPGWLVRPQSPVGLALWGTPGAGATAELVLRVGDSASTFSVPLSEARPGCYTGETTLPAGAKKVEKVLFRLAYPSQPAGAKEQSQDLGYPVCGRLTFTGLDNADGTFDGLTLTLRGNDFFAWRQSGVSGTGALAFSDLPPGNYSWSLEGNSRAYAQGEVTVNAGAEATVGLAGAPAPATLTFKTSPEGVNGGAVCRVSAGDRTWTQYVRLGQTLTGLAARDTVSYTVSLDWQELERYRQPQDGATVFVSGGSQEETVTLQELETVNLRGRVIDRDRDPQNNVIPLEGAWVRLYQSFQNGNRWVYNNLTATTDENGNFALKAYKGAEGRLSAGRTGYRDIEQQMDAASLTGDAARTLELECLDRRYVRVSLLVAPAVPRGEEREYLPAAPHRLYVEAYTPEGRVNGWYSAYEGRFLIADGENLPAGSELKLKAWNWEGLTFESSEVTVTLDRHLTAAAEFRALAPGYVTMRPVSEEADAPCYLLVFDPANNGRRVRTYAGTGTITTAEPRLPAGTYSLVLVSGANLTKLDRLASLDAFGSLGLGEGTHYLKREVSVAPGAVADLGELTVPALTDEELGRLDSQGTSIKAGQIGVSSDGSARVAVQVRYRLPERLVKAGYRVDTVQVSLTRQDGGEVRLVGQTFYLNDRTYAASGGSWLTVYSHDLPDSARSQGLLSGYVDLDAATALRVFGRVDIVGPDGKRYYEDIGARSFEFSPLSLAAPERVTAADEVQVTLRGLAPRDAEVEIRDGGVVVGNARADRWGRWQARVNLLQPQVPALHRLEARTANPKDGSSK